MTWPDRVDRMVIWACVVVIVVVVALMIYSIVWESEWSLGL